MEKRWLPKRKLRRLNGGETCHSSEVTVPKEMIEHLQAQDGDMLTFEPATHDAEDVVILRRQSA